MLNIVCGRPYKTYLIASEFCQNLSKSLDFSGILSKFLEIAKAVDTRYINSRNLVKFRTNFIKIGAKNDEIAGNLAKKLEKFASFGLNFCKNLSLERCESVHIL